MPSQKAGFLWWFFGFAGLVVILVGLAQRTIPANKLAKKARSLARLGGKLGYTRYNAAP
ncbi:hypothetical protein [Undibacterium sp. Ren11W]|uniref:hypothetical protein n=1 Tax=Undibacterium sp. Ren11W TaxID=3413045 RepID=UPI003BF0BF6F